MTAAARTVENDPIADFAVEAAVQPRRGARGSNRVALVGAATILCWIVIAGLGPFVVSHRPDLVNVAARLLPPSSEHWMGTDELGRDVLSRLIYGARVSLFAGFVVVLLGAFIGIGIGGIAGYFGGWIEAALMRLTDLVLCFPPIVLAMAIAAALGIGTLNTMLAMLVVWWTKFARLARSTVLVQRSQEYVEAASTLGYRPTRILFRHVLPNAMGPLIVLMTLDFGHALIVFSSLSFLGLGVVPPTPEWGAMISEGRELVEQWWVATFPGIAILTVVMGFNFLGDGIRDWLDPRSQTR